MSGTVAEVAAQIAFYRRHGGSVVLFAARTRDAVFSSHNRALCDDEDGKEEPRPPWPGFPFIVPWGRRLVPDDSRGPGRACAGIRWLAAAGHARAGRCWAAWCRRARPAAPKSVRPRCAGGRSGRQVREGVVGGLDLGVGEQFVPDLCRRVIVHGGYSFSLVKKVSPAPLRGLKISRHRARLDSVCDSRAGG